MSAWELIPENLTPRLALTLLHFCWQGFGVVLVLLFLGGLLRLRRPESRYALYLAALLVMAGCPLATFWILGSGWTTTPITQEAASSFPQDSLPPASAAASAAATTNLPATSPAPPPSEPGPTIWQSWLQSAQWWIVLGWAIGVGLLGLRLLLGWAWLQRLKYRVEPVPQALREQAERLSQALHLRLPRIQVCRHVSEAIALGLVRPLILIPASWLTELPPDMLEAVLAHELAHLRRWDLWINLFQRLTEMLLFYHPAVWWLSRRLRIERELCCDSVAVALTQNRLRYAETLELVGRLAARATPPHLAVAMNVSRGNLLKRVQHVLNPRSANRPTAPWFLSVLALVVLIAMWRGALYVPAAMVEDREWTGIVVDLQDQPVPHQEVLVYADESRTTLRTDAKGQFTVPHGRSSEAAEMYTFVARGQQGLGWQVLYPHLRAPSANLPLKVVLLPLTQSVRGVLTDQQGKPLPGIGVRPRFLYYQPTSAQWTEGLDEALFLPAAVTDSHGRFSIALPVGAHGELRSSHPDWTAVRIHWKNEQGDLGQIALEPGGRVEGRVIDVRTNMPIAGARVSAGILVHDMEACGYGAATSDQQGAFAIGGLKPGQYNVYLDAVPGHPQWVAPARESIRVEAGKASQADLHVSQGRLLSGKVMEAETGQPAPACHVGYYGSARPRSNAYCMMVRTDAEGNFRFHVPAGVSYVYVAEGGRAGVDDSSRTIDIATDRDPEPLVLKVGPAPDTRTGACTTAMACITPEQEKAQRADDSYRLKAVFRTSDGRPVGGAIVSLVYRGARALYQFQACSGNSFEDRFSPDQAGSKASYVVNAQGFALAQSNEFVIGRTMPPLIIDLQPAVYVPVRGRVLDQQGKPVVGARVRSRRIIFHTPEDSWGVEAVTDQAGRFDLKRLAIGDRFYVRVDKPGTGGAESGRVLIERDAPIDLGNLRLGPADKTIRGRVANEDDVPVAGAQVVYKGAAVLRATTDDQGKFEFHGLPIEDGSLSITAPGFYAASIRHRPGSKEVKARLQYLPPADQNAYQLRILLRPADGKAVASTHLSVEYPDMPRHGWFTEFKGNQYGGNLWNQLRRHPETACTLVVWSEGYAQPRPVTVTLRKNAAPVVIDLEPAPAVCVRGRVLHEDGRPFHGVKVGLSRELYGKVAFEPWRYSSKPPDVLVTDANGRFEIPNVHPGSRIAVYVNKPGYAGAWSAWTDVKQSMDVTLPDLVLKPATGEIAGRLIDPTGQPVAGAKVWIPGFGRIDTTSSADGRFRLRGLAETETWIMVDAADYEEYSQSVAVGSKDVTIRLSPEP
jgi:beta-lactamase regulating signal transducer with metallopeptidase domain/protocatechuate 3,4-dioxygenase beta subunit